MGDDSCPAHDLSENASTPLVGSLTFYDLDRILGGACAAISCLAILLHLFNHAMHLSVPREQVKIMRVALLIPLYSIISFLCICFPVAEVYLLPWLDVCQANSLVAYFLLLCEYVSPHHEQREIFFSGLEIEDKKAPGGKADGVKWFRQRWVMVFQYPIISLLVAIATDVTEAVGVYCQYETKPGFARLWLTILDTLSPGAAFVSIVLVAKTLKPHMPHNRPISKLVAIKLIVGLGFLQRLLFWILDSTDALKPTDKFTYADLNMGLPSLLSSIEMVPISVLMIWAYPVHPYTHGPPGPESSVGGPQALHSESYQGGFLGVRAFLNMMNPAETIEGIVLAFKVVTKQTSPVSRDSRHGETDQAYLMNQR